MEKVVPKILIIDDDPNVFKMIQFYLSKENYQLHFVQNGRQAFSLLSHDTFDVILVDMMMPQMDGPTFINKLSAMPAFNALIIVVTALGPTDQIMKTISDGTYDILQKPFTANRLKLTLHNALKYKRMLEKHSAEENGK